jgi:outer membrane protein assembly factor BamC
VNPRLRNLILALLLPALGGCSFLFGPDGVFRDTSRDYRQADELPVMKLPEGRESDSLQEIYAIPQVADRGPTRSAELVPRPAPLVSGNANQLVRIQRLGDDSWALIGIAPGQLWPQLRSFLSAANVEIARMDAREGIIESSYLELQEQERPARFRFRVERGVQRGNSELHVLQQFLSSDQSWPAQSDDLDLESEMLRGVAQYIANSADTAPVSMMAEQSISASGKVFIEEAESGSFIVLELSFDRAWASLARALDQSGFEITDRNRSEGLYYLSYRGDEDDSESGWFGWLSGGDDEHPAAGVPLLASVRSTAEERVEIHLDPEAGKDAMSGEELESLLVLIKGNIN